MDKTYNLSQNKYNGQCMGYGIHFHNIEENILGEFLSGLSEFPNNSVKKLISTLHFILQNENIESTLEKNHGIEFFEDIETQAEIGQIYFKRMESTGHNLGRIARIWAPEYRPNVLYNCEVDKAYVIVPFAPISMNLFVTNSAYLVEKINWFQGILKKIENKEVIVDQVLEFPMLPEELDKKMNILDPNWKLHWSKLEKKL